MRSDDDVVDAKFDNDGVLYKESAEETSATAVTIRALRDIFDKRLTPITENSEPLT
jgi:hypothetical protein